MTMRPTRDLVLLGVLGASGVVRFEQAAEAAGRSG